MAEKVDQRRKSFTSGQVVVALNFLLTAVLLVVVPLNVITQLSNAERISQLERELAEWREQVSSTKLQTSQEAEESRVKREVKVSLRFVRVLCRIQCACVPRTF